LLQNVGGSFSNLAARGR